MGHRMRYAPATAAEAGFDAKRTVILLRSAVVVSTSYLILFAEPQTTPSGVAYILTLLLSNVALACLPRELFHKPHFAAALLLGDTAAVLVGLYHTVGFSQDFLIVYFFTIFLTTAAANLVQIATGATLVAGLYGYWLWMSSPHGLTSGEWLRLPFFFIIAVFYAYVTEETKRERRRRVHAEAESEQLRFLLSLGNTFSQRVANRELVGQIGSLVQAAFPRVACEVHLDSHACRSGGELWLPIAAHGQTFGWLSAKSRDGKRLRAEEEQCCRVVALAAGNALYTAEQVAAAREGDRVKEEFLGVMSHELRTPLHAILGYAEMVDMMLETGEGESARESLGRLRANASRMQDLVEEMLCFAELRAGQTSLRVEPVDLCALFEHFAAGMDSQLAGRPIRFEWSVESGLAEVRTDKRKLRQLVSGLLSNATKFTERGFVRLSARLAAEGIVEIEVRDSGIGIDPKDFARIFEKFRQLDGSLTRRFDGIGLGLPLAQALAHTLGGRIEVDSRPREGASFRVRLPRDAGSPAGVGALEKAAVPRGVDDDEIPVFIRPQAAA